MRLPPGLTLPLIVACALFMENLDGTIISTSLPVIATDLAENPIALKLALTAYLVSLAVFIPISGWMADRYGSRTVFRSAIAVFVLGSLACGFSSSLAGFVAARFVQGMGGAMMVPVGRLVLLKSVEKRELVKVLSYLTMPALLGPILGPPLGGFISTYWHWRWIFFINVPIGLVGWLLAGRYVPEIVEEVRRPLDWVGFVLSGFGLSALTLGAATFGQHLLAPLGSGLCIVSGTVSIVLYVRHARRLTREGRFPVLDFRFLKVKTYFAGVVGGSLFRIGVGATPFLLPLMLQLGFGYSALQSGMLTCSSAAAAMFMKTLATRILKRFGFRTVMSANALIASLTIGGYGVFSQTTPIALMLGTLLFGGFFRSLQFTSLNALSYADVDRRDMGSASGLVNVAQQISLSTGVTLGAAALEAFAFASGRSSTETIDFRVAFAVVGLVSASSFFLMRRLPANAGGEVSGHTIADAEPPMQSGETPEPPPPGALATPVEQRPASSLERA
jgi:EmrB/QacA subfamily drug resistance transporter